MTTAYTLNTLLNPRTFIGFDDLEKEVNEIFGYVNSNDSFPPYNIIKVDDDHHLIELAIAGYSEEDIDLTVDKSTLIIRGSKRDKKDSNDSSYVYRGISSRSFKRAYKLGQYVKVEKATLNDGILSISLIREIPDEEKPTKIKIGDAPSKKRFLRD